MMVIKELGLYLGVKLIVLLLLCIFVLSVGCNGSGEQVQSKSIGATAEETYTSPCPSEGISCVKEKNNILEEILDVYIHEEKLNGKDDFIYISSNCWTDTSYIIIMLSLRWGDKVDSLIFKESSKIARYRDITICLNKGRTTEFPIPTHVEVVDKPIERCQRIEGEFVPFNEYFNDLQFSYSPDRCQIISVFKNGSDSRETYERLFRVKELMQ